MSPARRRQMVGREHPSLSLVRQCALLGISRSSICCRPRAASPEDLSLMGEIDPQYLETPFSGTGSFQKSAHPADGFALFVSIAHCS